MQTSKSSDTSLGQPGQMSTIQGGQITEQPSNKTSQGGSVPGPWTGFETITSQIPGSLGYNPNASRSASQYTHSGEANPGIRPLSPTVAIAGAGLPEEFLRAMNVNDGDEKKLIKFAQPDPCEQDSTLGLSGNIISVTFCVPYKIKRTTNSIWVRMQIHGTSASANSSIDTETSSRHFFTFWFVEVSLVGPLQMEPYLDWLAWGDWHSSRTSRRRSLDSHRSGCSYYNE
jgi:hypothetical protein